MKTLVIVESPTKARTISRFLGGDYEIIASMGHIMDLPKSTLGVDLEKDFAPDYQVMVDKKKIIAELKTAAKKAEKIILATDPDREGEAIAWHIKEILGEKDTKISSKKNVKTSISKSPNISVSRFERIAFHEITKEAIEEALKAPRDIDENLVDAQTARRVLDRLVGYKLSPILWRKVRRGLSAGRVQSVALRLIVEREREIEKFKKEPYFTVNVNLNHRGPAANSAEVDTKIFSLPAQDSKKLNLKFEGSNESSENFVSPRANGQTAFELIEINKDLPAMLGIAMQAGKIEISEKLKLYDGEYTFAKTSIDTEDKAKVIEADLKTKEFKVSDVTKKEMRKTPPPPYTTSTLQQDGARRMGLSGKRTMSLAQKLYEEGFITYHRTDSLVISESARKQMSEYVKQEFGANYLPPAPRYYKATQKNAQEAHEAIRPTNVNNQASIVSEKLGAQFAKLYEVIWKRTVATQMADAITESTVVLVDVGSKSAEVDTKIFSLPAQGSKKLNLKTEGSNESSENFVSPRANSYTLKANGSVLVFDGFLKVNPLALNDTRLPDFAADEELAYISSLPEAHETTPPPRYNDASIIKALEEEGIGRPSTYATIISTIESRQYIERNEGKFLPTSVGFAVNDFLVTNFSTIDDIPFTAQMEDELDKIASGERKWSPVIKEFYDPFAKTLEEVGEAARVKIEVEKTDEICPQDKGHLIIRTGKFGKFMACENFPTCKFTKPYSQETGLVCPKDGGKIVFKKTKKGRRFYGCGNYPKCDFASWTKPTSEHVERSEIPDGNDHREKIEDIKNPKEQISKEELPSKSEDAPQETKTP